MTLLAIESATNLVGAAILTDAGGIAERSHHGGRLHAELLAPAIAEVCAVSGVTVRDIDVVAVDIGPGLFTGLRVGVATAKAMAQALGVGVLCVSSLDVLAGTVESTEGADEHRGEDPLTVVSVVDARRGEVFTARYRFVDPTGDPARALVGEAELLAPDELAASLVGQDRHTGNLVMVGDGAVRYRNVLSAVLGADLSLADQISSPSPVALARLAHRRLKEGAVPMAPRDVVPDYRRDADARINWEQRSPSPAGALPDRSGQ
jgi:tRNA threonylcarbamoyladenosine biosynthesis protein TsaB